MLSNDYNSSTFQKKAFDDEYDYKVVKKQWPQTDNDQILEFRFDRDPNLFLQKNKIVIRGSIECDKNYCIDNSWVAKMFSSCTVEVDSQVITKNLNRYYIYH